jgi:hypothetical protein
LEERESRLPKDDYFMSIFWGDVHRIRLVAQESITRRCGKTGFVHQPCDSLHSFLLDLHGSVVVEFESGKMVTVSQPSCRISTCRSFSFIFCRVQIKFPGLIPFCQASFL